MDNRFAQRMLVVMICFAPNMALSQQTRELPVCTSTTSPPCVHGQRDQSLEVCGGHNVSTSVTLKLPLYVIQEISTIDIAVYNSSKPIFLGASKNPTFRDKGRWRMSQLISDVTDKSGLLTVMLQVDDVHPEDGFSAHIEIQMRDQTLSTPNEMWIQVIENCSHPNTNQPDEVASTERPDELFASIQHLLESTEYINMECKEFLEGMRSKTVISFTRRNAILATVVILLILTLNVMYCIFHLLRSRYLRSLIRPGTRKEIKVSEEHKETVDGNETLALVTLGKQKQEELDRWKILKQHMERLYDLLDMMESDKHNGGSEKMSESMIHEGLKKAILDMASQLSQEFLRHHLERLASYDKLKNKIHHMNDELE